MQKERSLSTKHGRRHRGSARMSSCSPYWCCEIFRGWQLRLRYIWLYLVQVRLGVKCAHEIFGHWKYQELTYVRSTLFVKREKRLPTPNIRGIPMHFRPVAFLLGVWIAKVRIDLQPYRYYRSQTSSDQNQNTTPTQQSTHDTFARFRITLSNLSFCILSKTADKYVWELSELNFGKLEGPNSVNSDCPSWAFRLSFTPLRLIVAILVHMSRGHGLDTTI